MEPGPSRLNADVSILVLHDVRFSVLSEAANTRKVFRWHGNSARPVPVQFFLRPYVPCMAAPWTRASKRLGRTPSATRRRKSWASDLSKWMRSVRRRWSFHHRAAEQEDAQHFLALTPYGSQAASIKVRSAAAISMQRNFRMIAAQRERQRLKAAHDEYWEYAYQLLREDSAERLQHC